MSNSIRDNLTKVDIVSEIRLSLSADIERENVFLLVEGQDDVKFLKGVSSDNVIIFESFSGKTGILEIVEEFFEHDPRVIGIRDRDYEIITNKKIFNYDYTCLEMMLIKSEEAFNSIYNEYYYGTFVKDELRYRILSQLQYLSHLRESNEKLGWGIRFKGISINKAFNQQKQELDNNNILEQINKTNNNFLTEEMTNINNFEDSQISELEELLNITQGHDFLYLFSSFCLQKTGKSTSADNISSSLRCAYRKSDFEKTKLFINLEAYSSIHNFKIVS